MDLLVKEKTGFNKWTTRTIDPNINTVDKYFELSYDEFLNELKKNNVSIKDRETQELLEFEFNKNISIIEPIQNTINKLETEINKSVYELYELTSEDISIIENSFKE